LSGPRFGGEVFVNPARTKNINRHQHGHTVPRPCQTPPPLMPSHPTAIDQRQFEDAGPRRRHGRGANVVRRPSTGL
jgi:hypothetical protein